MTSAPVSETAPPAVNRPTVVTVAYWLQVSLVVALLIVVGVSIADAIHYNGLIDEAVRTTSSPDTMSVSWEREDNIASLLFVAVPLFVLAAWLGVTSIFVRRGSNVGRVLTWVGLGAPAAFLLLSCVLGILGGFAFFMIAMPFEVEEEPAFDEEDPSFTGDAFSDSVYNLDSGGWSVAFDVITAACLMLALLLAVAVIVLLATGPAARWFRRGEPVRRSPVPAGFPYAATPVPYYPPPAAGPFVPAAPAYPFPAAPYPYPAPPAGWGAPPPYPPAVPFLPPGQPPVPPGQSPPQPFAPVPPPGQSPPQPFAPVPPPGQPSPTVEPPVGEPPASPEQSPVQPSGPSAASPPPESPPTDAGPGTPPAGP